MIQTRHEGAVTTVVMSRPPVNAIDPAFVTAFNAVLDEVDRQRPTLVVIRSAQRTFCAGADLSLIRSWFDDAGGTERMVAYVRTLHRLFDRIEALPAVTLACIQGAALGGGLELALACDLRIATFDARLGLPEARVGMIPGAGGTQRLTRLAGPGAAARLILSADVVDGREAQRLGIAQWTVDTAAFDAEMARIADRVGGLSRDALAASKDCMHAFFDPAVNGFEREIEKPLALMRNADSKARVARFFTPKAG
ncbi:MAG: enoyl-CoA hydratase/isomerase family protein [Dokdonella sp.]|nr:enoyl-CoA hydratase/isomerase family protein [Dokdonella sp.]